MPKNFTLACLCSFRCLFANAQFDKGQKVLSGNMSFSGGKNDNLYTATSTTKFANFSVGPSIGWFTSPKQLFGISLSYGNYYHKEVNRGNATENTSRNSPISAGVFTERFISLAKNLFFTIDLSAGVSVTPRETNLFKQWH